MPRRGLVIAPRGEMDESALAIKRRRKRLYLWFVQRLRLLDDGSIRHAASKEEAQSIGHRFGTQIRVAIAADIPMRPSMAGSQTPKQAGTLDARSP